VFAVEAPSNNQKLLTSLTAHACPQKAPVTTATVAANVHADRTEFQVIEYLSV
jgi:hypothetical protein